MGKRPEESNPGQTRRDFLIGGVSALAGVGLTLAGESLLNSGENDPALIMRERKKVLDNIFFSDDRDFFLWQQVANARVSIPAGTYVHNFPSRQHRWMGDENGNRTEIDNERFALGKSLAVEQPAMIAGGMYDIAAGDRWVLINGPEGVGYVPLSLYAFEGAVRDVLLASYRSWEDESGKLRFTASGFAYQGKSDFGSDNLWMDFDASGQPNVQRLGEGMETSEFIEISQTY